MDTIYLIAAYFHIFLAFFHIPFYWYFKWKEDFRSVSLLNRQMTYVHTFFLAFVLLLLGIFMLKFQCELKCSEIGNAFHLGLSIFWFTRLFFQLFVYKSELWKGKLFETIIHILFILIWIGLGLLYLIFSSSVCKG